MAFQSPTRLAIACVCLAGWIGEAGAQAPRIRGEASLAGVLSDAPGARRQLLGRYLPEISGGLSLTSGVTADVAASANIWVSRASASASGGAGRSEEGLEPYRAWLRISSPRLELRAGLQRISFGSAGVLRSLMWFDRIDPRDPLQLTEGVWALLGRAYLPGNVTLWGWAVNGDGERRGWDAVPGRKDELERGGRLQLPMGPGEVAVSYHHRRLDLDALGLFPPGTAAAVREDRFGIDGKWDVELGLWFEAELSRQDSEALEEPWLRAFTAGADYTFDVGNGLTVQAEHMVREVPSVRAPAGNGVGSAVPLAPTLRLTAFTASYAPGVLDRLGLAVYRDWEGGDWFALLEWRRTYDRWRVHLAGFWNPSGGGLFPSDLAGGEGSSGSLAGTGVQLIVVFNH